MQYKFYDKVQEILDKIHDTQSKTIEIVAEKLVSIIEEGGVIYTFGTGHSHILAEEIYARAGGLFQVKGILEPELMLHHAHGKSTLIERLPGYAEIVLEINKLRKKDALIIISNSGRNSATIELAIKAKEKGILVIALTNIEHSSSVTSRDQSGKKLYEVADYVLDNCGVPGDAILDIKDKTYKVAPTSTIAGAIILQALTAEIVEKGMEKGISVPVMVSANLDGNESFNQNQKDDLMERFPELKYILS